MCTTILNGFKCNIVFETNKPKKKKCNKLGEQYLLYILLNDYLLLGKGESRLPYKIN